MGWFTSKGNMSAQDLVMMSLETLSTMLHSELSAVTKTSDVNEINPDVFKMANLTVQHLTENPTVNNTMNPEIAKLRSRLNKNLKIELERISKQCDHLIQVFKTHSKSVFIENNKAA